MVYAQPMTGRHLRFGICSIPRHGDGKRTLCKGLYAWIEKHG
jgi:hypothetical protein